MAKMTKKNVRDAQSGQYVKKEEVIQHKGTVQNSEALFIPFAFLGLCDRSI